MSVHMSTKGAGAVSHEDVNCVLGVLSAPGYVVSHIETTRALDGQQVDEWGEFAARWTYHPRQGLQITIIDNEAE